MKILLFNDNPVVRKLVALSAQKTKDDLNVVWTIDEAEGGVYDLLIIDDGVYSDEMRAMLNEKISYSVSLLMATRGNSVPAGFDHVINKPFLPTDLVDMFVQIQKNIDSEPATKSEMTFGDLPEDETGFAINLDEELPDLEEDLIDLSADTFADDLQLEGLEGLVDSPLPNILDEEEVKEVRDLLADTEEDLFTPIDEEAEESSDEMLSLGDDLDLEALSDEEMHLTDDAETENDESLNFDAMLESLKDDLETAQEDDFDLEGLGETIAAESAEVEDNATMDAFDIEGLEEMAASVTAEEESGLDEAFSLEEELSLAALEEEVPDVAILADEELKGDEELTGMEEDEFALEADEGPEETERSGDLDSLEQQILDAVGGLEDEELDMELDVSELGIELPQEDEEAFEADMSADADATFAGLDELDMLDERELKLAIGEEVEDLEEEPQIRVGAGSHAALDTEALEEAFGHEIMSESSGSKVRAAEEAHAAPTAEGVEALQALLKALANEEVAKSLKNLNISININFGNNQ